MTSQTLPPHVKALILDMDGVLWKDDEPLVDLPAVFGRISELGLKVVLATNNATRSVDMYLEKLTKMGVSLETWQIVTSPQAVVHLLRQRFPQGGKVHILGEKGLVDTLTNSGYTHGEKDVVAVVAGLDRNLTYAKLKAAALIINAGVPFIATNQDPTLPTPEGMIPGAGSIIAALITATATQPLLAGKPSPTMYQLAFERLGIDPKNALAIGDRLDTDIAGGIQAGCMTSLVLSGATKSADIPSSPYKPDLVFPNLGNLLGL